MVPYGICEAHFTHRSCKTSRITVKPASRINLAASMLVERGTRSFLAAFRLGKRRSASLAVPA